MKIKKITAALLALSLSLTAFAGCGGTSAGDSTSTDGSDTSAADGETAGDGGSSNAASEESGSSENLSAENFAELYGEETIPLTIYSQTANYSGKLAGWFGKILKDKFNCEVTIIPDSDGAFDTRMESGSLGDIVIFGGDGDEYKRASEQGKLFDWNEDDILSDYGANIQANMPYALEKNMDINEANGVGRKVLGFAHDVATSPDDHQSFMYTWDVRWDLYEQLGRPEVKTLDDFVSLMSQMKEICPSDDNGDPTYAVSLWPDWDGNMVMYVKAFASAYFGYDELEMGLYDVETGDYHFALESDGPYMESLEFFNKLYQNGLVDPNSMTQTYDQMREKFSAGGAFFSIFNYAGSQLYNTDEHKADNKMMMTLTPEDATPIAYGMNVMGADRIWSIGADTKYPELCMAIINYLTTSEGYMTYRYGPK
ncbi:MAG: extracellular solute-binding protein, partial [Huintestinicola sp.]